MSIYRYLINFICVYDLWADATMTFDLKECPCMTDESFDLDKGENIFLHIYIQW